MFHFGFLYLLGDLVFDMQLSKVFIHLMKCVSIFIFIFGNLIFPTVHIGLILSFWVVILLLHFSIVQIHIMTCSFCNTTKNSIIGALFIDTCLKASYFDILIISHDTWESIDLTIRPTLTLLKSPYLSLI